MQLHMRSLRFLRPTAFAATVLALVATSVLALDTAALDKQVSSTLDKFYALSDEHQPMVQHAVGVLVFPDVTKGGIGIGGEHGDGALQQGGKTTGYYSTSGASIGLTLGLSHHSEVILFNTQDALDKILSGSDWSIGGDASVAVMKTGAGGKYDTQSLSKPVEVFIFGERGLMGDVSLKGGKIHRIQ